MQMQVNDHNVRDFGFLPGSLFVLSGASAVGKTTAMYALCERFKAKEIPLVRIITYTTRKPRAGERDGIDYHFVSEEKFCELREADFFIEWSCAYGAYYGSPSSIRNLLAQGLSCIIVLDRNGVRSLMSSLKSVLFPILIFSSRGTTRSLIESRGAEDSVQQQLRSLRAQQESDDEQQDSLFSWCVDNQDIDKTVHRLEEIVFEVQKQRLFPYKSGVRTDKNQLL